MTLAEYNQSVHDYADRLYRFVLKSIRDRELASDLVQDTFEKMWRKHNSIDYEKARAYLFTTAYHTLIDYTRKASVKNELNTDYDIRAGAENAPHDLKESLDWALSRIPEVQRSVILLSDYEGYSYDEIGKIMNLSESQVKVYIFRGRMALRKLIGNPEVLI